MKTDDLVALLAAQTPAVDRRAHRLKQAAWLAAATLIAVLVVLMWQRLNPRLASAAMSPWFWVRFAFIASIVALAWHAFARLGRPGVAARVQPWWLVTPVVLLGLVASALLWQAPQEARLAMLLGVSWDVCSRNIAILSLPFFLASIWVARAHAPTRLALTGAILGIFSGALGALVYTLHCPEMEPAFLLIWYGIGIAIPGVVGAIVGRRLLAW